MPLLIRGLLFSLLAALFVTACEPPRPPKQETERETDFAAARSMFRTKLAAEEQFGEAAETPPENELKLVSYSAPKGFNAAYLSRDPKDGQKHPAIIWLFGGTSNSIGNTAWEPATADNDQSAAVFRRRGVVTLYASLRGGNTNPGFKEGLLGEVDDVIAARKYLATVPYVDAERIYLGGHSTGGTLALLVAAADPSFRTVFAFGPVSRITDYGPETYPVRYDDTVELVMRSPIAWLDSIKIPTVIIEGAGGNIDCLRELKAAAGGNPHLRFVEARDADHFSVLAPISQLIADKIRRDSGKGTGIRILPREIDRIFKPQ